MKIKVKYQQKYDGYVYKFYRIIELNPTARLFKHKIKTLIYSTFYLTKIDYYNRVRHTLDLTEDELIKWIKPVIEEYLSDPNTLRDEIRNFEIELDV